MQPRSKNRSISVFFIPFMSAASHHIKSSCIRAPVARRTAKYESKGYEKQKTMATRGKCQRVNVNENTAYYPPPPVPAAKNIKSSHRSKNTVRRGQQSPQASYSPPHICPGPRMQRKKPGGNTTHPKSRVDIQRCC